jgi:hypothetical protein
VAVGRASSACRRASRWRGVVLRDPATGSPGRRSSRFEVLKPDILRLSTPILSDRVELARWTQRSPGRRSPSRAPSRRTPASHCQFEVIGAGPDGKPRCQLGPQPRPATAAWRESPASPVALNNDGRAVRLVGIDLAGLAEGSYDLVRDGQDDIGGSRLRQREPFSIVNSPAAQ